MRTNGGVTNDGLLVLKLHKLVFADLEASFAIKLARERFNKWAESERILEEASEVFPEAYYGAYAH